MNTENAIPSEIIMNKIYFVRDRKVMLDLDLTILFDVKNIRLREQVKEILKIFLIILCFD
jgi:hypothetical protein